MYLSTPAPTPGPSGDATAQLAATFLSSHRFHVFEEHPPGNPAHDWSSSDWSSLIGITTAIVGNALIALALNVQRYAHIRLHRERHENRERARQALKRAQDGNRQRSDGYGTASEEHPRNGDQYIDESDGHGDAALESDPLAQSFQSAGTTWTEGSEEEGETDKASTSYLRSPYWWLGQILITVGEMGNFLAYGFAPASIVSPLGVVALISNCVIAPIFFKEVFRTRDFWGVVIAVTGAVTVVLSANQTETKLEPHDVWDAITTTAFEVYMGITASLIALLMWASPRYGNRTILIDLGLVGLFGGYTALSTKGVSSMLSSTLLGAFTTPVTYALLLVLLVTAVMQVRYVNKALQRFDSTQVIPIQFVTFTLSVIIGSAVLYRDFERTTAEQAVKFVGGCLLTFFGVFLITSGRPRTDEDEETLSDEEGVDETIGLAEQGAAPTQQTPEDDEALSRRSSRTSRVSFVGTLIKPLTVLVDSGSPMLRVPGASASRSSVPSRGDDEESEPLLRSPWHGSPSRAHLHPGMGPKALSSDSAVTIHSSASAVPSEPVTHPGTPSSQVHPIPDVAEGTGTPRGGASLPRPHSHHFSGPIFSPSPLSSTVSAVVSDTLLKKMDSPLARRLSLRRSRPSLRASLFVPQDELEEDRVAEDETVRAAGRQGVSEPLSRDEQEGPEEEGKPGIRRRARSLSNTLIDFFGTKKRRKSVIPQPHDEQVPAVPGASRPEALARTETS